MVAYSIDARAPRYPELDGHETKINNSIKDISILYQWDSRCCFMIGYSSKTHVKSLILRKLVRYCTRCSCQIALNFFTEHRSFTDAFWAKWFDNWQISNAEARCNESWAENCTFWTFGNTVGSPLFLLRFCIQSGRLYYSEGRVPVDEVN